VVVRGCAWQLCVRAWLGLAVRGWLGVAVRGCVCVVRHSCACLVMHAWLGMSAQIAVALVADVT